MAALTTQKPSTAGVALTYGSAAGGGDTFVNTGREFVHIKNQSGGTITVTISSGSNKCSFGVSNAAHDITHALLTMTDAMLGPFSKDQFNDASGNVNITYSGVTSLTLAVLANA